MEETGIKEKLKAKIISDIDMSAEIMDEDIGRVIDKCILEESENTYIPLKEKVQLRIELFNSLRRLDVLTELLEDDEITEIMVNGPDNIYIEKSGHLIKTDKSFESEERLRSVVQQIVAGCNRRINESSPIVDARLKDGSRVNIVQNPVSLCGPVITIRRFPDKPVDMERLIELESLDKNVAFLLQILVESGFNIFISGGTGSGKTTFLNALSNYIPKEERIITIEDSAELQIQGVSNLVRLEAKNANLEGENAVTIRDLIKTSLRMRPDRIIVGEVRDAAAIDMLAAMGTGHDGSLSTGHANSAADMISRLETMVLMGMDIPIAAVRGQIASAVDIIIHLGRLRDGTRRVLSIEEVNGMTEGNVKLNSLFEFVETGEENGRLKGVLKKMNDIINVSKLESLKCTGRHTVRYKPYIPGTGWYVFTFLYLGVIGIICGFLFYDALWGTVFTIPYLAYIYRKLKKDFVAGRKRQLKEEFKNVISGVSGSLQAGYSIENAFLYALSEIKSDETAGKLLEEDLRLLINGMQCGKGLERGLKELGDKSNIEEIKELAYLVKTAGIYGGNLIRLMGQCTRSMTEKSITELEIHTMIASKRLEGKIMSVIPFFIMLYLRLTGVSYIDVLYKTVWGHVFMTICLAGIVLTSISIDKIINSLKG